MTNHPFLTIKEAATLYNRSEQTIRRLVKQYVSTDHVRSEQTSKGKAYQISQTLLLQEYEAPSLANLSTQNDQRSLYQDNNELREAIMERDQIIQQLKNRLLEQNNLINNMNNHMTIQKINSVEELLIQQNLQLGSIEKHLYSSDVDRLKLDRSKFWTWLFGR